MVSHGHLPRLLRSRYRIRPLGADTGQTRHPLPNGLHGKVIDSDRVEVALGD